MSPRRLPWPSYLMPALSWVYQGWCTFRMAPAGHGHDRGRPILEVVFFSAPGRPPDGKTKTRPVTIGLNHEKDPHRQHLGRFPAGRPPVGSGCRDGDEAGHRSSNRHGDEATPSHENGDGTSHEDEQGSAGSAPPRPRAASETGVRAFTDLRPSVRVNLDDAEGLRTRWVLVFLLQQRSPANPRPCSQGRG